MIYWGDHHFIVVAFAKDSFKCNAKDLQHFRKQWYGVQSN
jgi:hypothetical protein